MSALTKRPLPQMEIPEFLAWSEQQPGRWQLRDGEPVLMAPLVSPLRKIRHD